MWCIRCFTCRSLVISLDVSLEFSLTCVGRPGDAQLGANRLQHGPPHHAAVHLPMEADAGSVYCAREKVDVRRGLDTHVRCEDLSRQGRGEAPTLD
jgi:hypothetical protein